MRRVEHGLFWRAAGLQAATVGALFVLLAVLLPRSFFRQYGEVTGPVAWTACALVTGWVLSLRPARVIAAAMVAGALAALVGIAAGHLAGLAVAVAAFGAVCALHSWPRVGATGIEPVSSGLKGRRPNH